MRIDIWSDIVCPWCYIGKRHLETALGELGTDDFTIHWHSFELAPHAPKTLDQPLTELLAEKYGMSLAQAQAAQDRVTQTAAGVGLEFHLDRAQTGNTFDAHRLIHKANTEGLGDALKERLMRAYFSEGRPISDHETLASLAAEVGLNVAEARELLAGDDFADDVRQDERQAHRMGVRGVPFFVIDERYAISGAQPPEALRQVLERARTEAHVQATETQHGAVCDDDSCAVP